MTEKEILARIAKIISEKLEVPIEVITMDADFVKDLGADSLDVVELIMAIEDEFKIEEIPESDAENIKLVKDAVAYLAAKLK